MAPNMASNVAPTCDSAAAASNMASKNSILMESHGIYGMGGPKNIPSHGISHSNPIPYLLVGMVYPPPGSHTDTVPWDRWDGSSRGIYHIFPATNYKDKNSYTSGGLPPPPMGPH